jgi:hypothetical protein
VKITLLGPQRRPTVGAVLRSLPGDGPVATITAGWQEREPDDAELSELAGLRDVNLRLYQRWLDVQERDPAFATAERTLHQALQDASDLYVLRLDFLLRAVHALQRRGDGGGLPADALDEALAQVRELDASHLRRVAGLEAEFYRLTEPHYRPVIAEHRAAVAGALAEAAAVVITGGHVGVLAQVLHLFHLAPALPDRVIAWSAGAMALSERIVLFGDRAPQGPGHPEAYGAGLGVLRGMVPLPHARARLLLDDAPRMAAFARRFAPARCVPLEAGRRLDTGRDGVLAPGTPVLAAAGRVVPAEAA